MMSETRGVAPEAVEAAAGLTHDTDAGGIDGMTTPTSKRTTSPAFQFYPSDFLGSTKVQLMSTTEVGAYVLLLCACWNDGGIPNDPRRLAGIARMKEAQFTRMWSHVLKECFVERGDRLVNQRLETERKKQSEYRKKQKDNADKGWQGRRNATALPSPVQSHAVGNALHLQSSSSSSIKNTHTTRASGPIHQTHKNHAACGRVCVPSALHGRFVQSLNRDDADSVLRDWYLSVDNEWSVGAQKDSPTGADDFAFWRARFDEKWPAPAPVKSRGPAWLTERV